jgi:hypothetical protein
MCANFAACLSAAARRGLNFALLAAGYDAGGKSPRAVLGVRSPDRKLGCQLLVDGNIVESA